MVTPGEILLLQWHFSIPSESVIVFSKSAYYRFFM